MILGHPFLDTDRALIDVKERQLILKVQDDKSLSICHQASLPILYSCFQVDAIVYKVVVSLHGFSKDLLETCIAQFLITEERYFEVEHMVIIWGTHHLILTKRYNILKILRRVPHHHCHLFNKYQIWNENLSISFELCLFGRFIYTPVIITNSLSELEEEKLLQVLRKHKEAICWTIVDIWETSPSLCMHKIILENNFKLLVDHQWRINQNMKEVVRVEVVKWLDASIIYLDLE